MLALTDWISGNVLNLTALFGAAAAFVVGLIQYRRAQHWKRVEWVAQEMKAHFDDPVVRAAMLMMDWGTRRIPLHPDRQDENQRHVRLTNEIVAKALMHHDARPDGFNDQEADIREAFDRALDGLERFHSYLVTGLVELDDLRPYLKYWAVTLLRPRNPRPEDHRLARLLAYMRSYGFDGALDLLERVAAAERGLAAEVRP